MPELPEVQTVVNELDSKVSGLIITNINVVSGRGIELELNDIEHFKVTSVYRRGKYIVFKGEKKDIIAHLRMTGKFVFSLEENERKHLRCEFYLSNNELMYFIDVRKFGTIEFSNDSETFFRKLGPEPLTEHFNLKYFQYILKKKTKPIKNALLDQSIVAGVGNIYADESLFLSRVLPTRKSNSLSHEEIELLVNNVKSVLLKSIKNMGTTLSDYRTTKNISGENQNYLNVYGLDGFECKHCNQIISRIKMAGRSAHFCSNCQK